MVDSVNIRKPPKVTVGVMAYNEEDHLGAALESILAQSYADFEVVIADNASTDATPDIGRQFADRYENVRYFRQPRNVGATLNFHSLVRAAVGRYFVLAGAHDLWSDNYLSALAEALEAQQDAVLAYGRTRWIDGHGRELAKPVSYVDTSDLGVVSRFNITIWANQHPLYGMYRTEALQACRTDLQIVANGAILLAELALRGAFVVVPEVTWYRRAVRDDETTEQRMDRYYGMLFDRKRMRLLPHWRIPVEHVWAVLRSDLRWPTKLDAFLSCGSVVVLHWRNLIRDVLSLFRRAMSGKLWNS